MELQDIPKKTYLTRKQKKFVKNIVNGESQTEAAVKAGYDAKNRVNARKIGSELMHKPHIREAIIEQLESAGIDEHKLAAKTAELLDADIDGMPQYETQRKTLDMLFKVRGAYAPERKEVSQLSLTEVFLREMDE